MSKQDRQGVRTPADVERKYNLGKLPKTQGMSEKEREQLNQLNQSLSQYMASNNAKIQEIEEEIEDKLTPSVPEPIESYNVTFYSESGVVIASFIINLGDAINPPVNNVSWVDGEGVAVTFPYAPTSDTSLYVQESTL